MRIVSVFFLSTENDLHRNLPVNIGRDINLHNNRVRAERVKGAPGLPSTLGTVFGGGRLSLLGGGGDFRAKRR